MSKLWDARSKTGQRIDVGEAWTVRWAWEPETASVVGDGKVLWVDFALYQNCAIDGDSVMYEPPDCDNPGEWTIDIDKAAPLVTGFVKWDGCTQWWQNDGGHCDEKPDFDDFCEAMRLARQVGLYELMTGRDPYIT